MATKDQTKILDDASKDSFIKVRKALTEVYFEYVGHQLRYRDGYVYLYFAIRNPFYNKVSLSSLRFQDIDGVWLPCTLAAEQREDLDEIEVSASTKILEIIWDAASDLKIMQPFENVHLAVSFNDRPYNSGRETPVLEFVVDSIDFTLKELPIIVSPNEYDPYFNIKFISPTTVRPCKMHFKAEIDTIESFDSPNLLVYDTSLDTTGWKSDGEDFPVDGVYSDKKHKIELIREDLSEMEIGDYFFRVLVVYSQFYPKIIFPKDGQVFVGETIDVQGIILVDEV